MKNYDVIIIGAGPAGLFSGLSLSETIGKVLILEKNPSPGKKLLITGAGQCNITQDGDIDDFFNHYGPNHRFLKHALLQFTNKDLVRYFHDRGLETMTNENNKVFPKSLKASDVLEVLLRHNKEKGVHMVYNAEVVKTVYEEDHDFKVYVKGDVYRAQHLIIATGGKSYPKTGASGDGYKFASMLGHNVVAPKEALTPVNIKNYPFKDLAGISLDGGQYSLWRGGKKLDDFNGDILFTHKGLSGPGILNHSRYMEVGDELKLSFLKIDNPDQFRQAFMKDLNDKGKVMIKTLLKDYDLPKRVIIKLLEQTGIAENIQCSQLNKKARNKLIKALVQYPLEIEALGGYHLAMVTKGGVSLKEINQKTMASKKVKGLHFIGEVLDVDGDTGGYNIQAAMSTARLAARSINNYYNAD